MKYFKDDNHCVYAYASDGSQDKFIKPSIIPITEKEAMDIANPPPTQDEVIAEAEAKKIQLRATADAEIAWRQDAVDAGIATAAETAALAEWKRYRVLLMRVDTAAPVWTTAPVERAKADA
ncbi:tail fiber assembly protein [Edwardsiella piscicida]|uniref:tail fiber assembly protein n=1 Tax=Edwardsiella piscicida TaxID=1263550 RepID=UPI000AA375A3|nr:tail fiber assembly protein [Edwardsiella piscicida]